MRIGTALFLLLTCEIITAQVIPQERRTDWTIAGYPGTIPDPDLILDATDFGAVGDSLTDNSTAIQDAVEFLEGRQGVIYFPEGVYLFNNQIIMSDSVVIRGVSSVLTHFVFDLGGDAKNCINISKSQQSDFISVTGGFEKGSTKIIVSDPSLFKENDYAELHQLNGNWDSKPISWAQYSVGQILFIEAISADTLFISNPLRIDYDIDLRPEIRVINPIRETGVECLMISRLDNTMNGVGYNCYLAFAANCWIRGVESNMSVGSHIYLTVSTNIEISGCYIHDAFDYDGSGTRGYGITLNMHTGQCLIENNILKHLRHALMVKTGANCNVFGYNYSLEPNRSEPISQLSGDISLHGHYAYANLFEGNIVQNIIIDNYWGPSGPWNTMFRNRAELYGIIFAVLDTSVTYMQSFVGNEITNTNTGFGHYIVVPGDHFEYGNSILESITPKGTDQLDDTSYYLSNIPTFWDITAPWPSLGIPNVNNEYNIPAKERYWLARVKTVCTDSLNTEVDVSPNNNQDSFFWPNPNNGIINLDIGDTSTDFSLFNLTGSRLLHIQGTKDQIQLPESLSNGIYFIRLSNDKISRVQNLILNR